MLDINWISCVFFHRNSIVRIEMCFPCENGANPRTHRGCTQPELGGYPPENTHGASFFFFHWNPASVPAVRAKSTSSTTRCHFVAIRRTSRPTLLDIGMQHLEAPDNSDRCPCNQLLSGDQGQHGTKCQIDPSPNASASPRGISACARKTGRPVHAKQEATTWFGENTSQHAIVDVTICDLQHGELRVDMSILSTV